MVYYLEKRQKIKERTKILRLEIGEICLDTKENQGVKTDRLEIIKAISDIFYF